MARWRVAGVNFDHFHMLDNLRFAARHADVEIVGISDEQAARMEPAIHELGLPPQRVFTDYRQCMEATKPDLVILCPTTAEHGIWTERISAYGTHILIEKPFAASLSEADRMVAAVARQGTRAVLCR